MKDESLENNIVFLHALGWSVRRLASEFKISRERVDRILSENLNARESGNDNESGDKIKSSKLDNYKQYIGEILEKYKDDPPTIVRALELIREKGEDYLLQLYTQLLPKAVHRDCGGSKAAYLV